MSTSISTPLIVGIGGSVTGDTPSDSALRYSMDIISGHSVRSKLFLGHEVLLPMYRTDEPSRTPHARALIEAIREADGIVLASPGCHGTFSGTLKNVLDYIEDIRTDARPYLEGRAVGIIVAASGWRAPGMALSSIRSVVHALRGWPTPMGVILNSDEAVFASSGQVDDEALAAQLQIMAGQVVRFTHWTANAKLTG